MPPLSGSCHCGKVRFEVEATSAPVFECTCSLCHRRGAVWQLVDAPQFRLLEGEAYLSAYRFGTRTAAHFFCRQCGVGPFSHPRIAPDKWVVNLRCVDGADLSTQVIQCFDGRHWEQAVAALMGKRGSR